MKTVADSFAELFNVMFCDQAEIEISAGRGGDGLCSFRREKFRPKGGPDGGNGGRGGNVILQANENLNSLIEFATRKNFQAPSGDGGKTNLKNGKAGSDLILQVPVGTQIFNLKNGATLADFQENGLQQVLATGGRGGFGNAHFKSSVRQAPNFAELGEKGESLKLKLELKLVADAGIIGLPSAGKSTLISVCSAARPKIGNFPFTTLVPNLGIAEIFNERLVLCDIPGLIEGAHQGRGLGHKFLRHVSRNLVLVHLVSCESANLAGDITIIEKELEKFDPTLLHTPRVLAISKVDILPPEKAQEILKQLQRKFPGQEIFPISAVSRKGVNALLGRVLQIVKKQKAKFAKEKPAPDHKIFQPHLERKNSKRFSIEQIGEKKFRVSGPRIEQIANMTDWSNFEALARLRDVLQKMGIEKELLKMGAASGAKLCFAQLPHTLEFFPDPTRPAGGPK